MVVEAGFSTQAAWTAGNISRFELVDHFIDGLIPHGSEEILDEFLPNLKILVTTSKNGYEAVEASNRTELRDLLIKTAWV